jgi:hypothetical protein
MKIQKKKNFLFFLELIKNAILIYSLFFYHTIIFYYL